MFNFNGVVGVQRDADTGGNIDHIFTKHERLRHAVNDLLRDDFGKLTVFELRENHGELVTAETRNGVGITCAFTDSARYLNQQIVADKVTVRVVHLFEVVQVNE